MIITRRMVAGLGAATIAVLPGISVVTAPGTATEVSGHIPGKTLVISVRGTQGAPATVRVAGPRGYARTLRVTGTQRLKKLRPGRYTLSAKKRGAATATDPVRSVRVRKGTGAKVRFTYRVTRPDVTPPPRVRDLRLVDRTSTSIRLAWTNPPDDEFLLVAARRSGGTDKETGDLVLDDDGRGLSETGLWPGTEYTYSVATEDEAGNLSEEVSITVRTLPG